MPSTKRSESSERKPSEPSEPPEAPETGEAADAEEDESKTSGLTQSEAKDAEERRPPSALVVFEAIRREGDEELKRPTLSLASSGLAAGLSMGASFTCMALLRSYLPDTPWRPLLENLGYTIGFLIVILGRQQLFTENTLTVILPLLDAPNKLRMLAKVGRLWGIVLGANLIGGFLFALAMAHTTIFESDVKAAFMSIGLQSAAPDWTTLFGRGVFAGWLIALMVWVLPAADQAKLFVILIITYVVGMSGLSHIIAGSIEVMYLVAIGHISFWTYLGGFALPVFAGNCVGGVTLVALLNYGQVVAETQGEAKDG
jgi:formate/nitrite transporter FocA (FNT family)